MVTAPTRPSTRRYLATEVDSESIETTESSLENALEEAKSIESLAQTDTIKYVPQIDSRSHITQNLLKDGTSEAYKLLRRKSTSLHTFWAPYIMLITLTIQKSSRNPSAPPSPPTTNHIPSSLTPQDPQI